MEKKISITILFIAFVFFALLGVFSLPAVSEAKTTTLSLSHFFPATHFVNTEMVAQWVKEVEKASGGQVKINVFPGATLLKPRETYDGIVSGTADIGVGVFAYTPLVSISEAVPLLP
jgi:TRAP-type C4-dicarboxylate transport system substrate-binding protein